MIPREIQPVLARYPLMARPQGPVEALGNAGGFSGSRLWRYRAVKGWLALKCWPEGFPASRLRRNHGWLSDAAALEFLALPLSDRDGQTVIEHPPRSGRIWDLTPWLPGQPREEGAWTGEEIHRGFRALARLHLALGRSRSRGPCPGLLARLGELRAWRTARLGELRARLAGRDPLADLARQWADAAEPHFVPLLGRLDKLASVEVELQPCWRDVRAAHVLFDDAGAITGLVDPGSMDVDSVAVDYARLFGEVAGTISTAREAAALGYESVRPVTPDEWTLIDALEEANAVLQGGQWARWHFLDGIRFDSPDAVAEGLTRGVRRVASRSCIVIAPRSAGQ